MPLRSTRSIGRLALLAGCLACVTSAAACAGEAPKAKKGAGDAAAESDYEGNGSERGRPLPPPADYENDDAGVFSASERKSTTAGSTDGGGRGQADSGAARDASAESGGGSGGACVGPLKVGDLAVVELMIRAAEGAGDKAEWIEIQSTRGCELNLKGLKITSPRGEAGPADTAEVMTDLFLPRYRMVLVASSRAPAVNDNLPGAIITFSGETSDVLQNDGDTIVLSAAGVEIDRLAYPKFTNLVAGRSITFPWDCAWRDRADWARWSYSFYGWSGTSKGTPNADNDDVACY